MIPGGGAERDSGPGLLCTAAPATLIKTTDHWQLTLRLCPLLDSLVGKNLKYTAHPAKGCVEELGQPTSAAAAFVGFFLPSRSETIAQWQQTTLREAVCSSSLDFGPHEFQGRGDASPP